MTAQTGRAWRVVGASVQGVSHQRNRQPCQDAHAWQELESGVLLVAVADGAGSAPLSDVGASIAVQAAISEAAERLCDCLPYEEDDWRWLLRNVFLTARNAVETNAHTRGHVPSELATTLVLAIATPHLVAAAQVGDGAAIARLGEDRFVNLTRPPTQEYVNETTFLTSQDFLNRTQFIVSQVEATGLAVFSDGLQMLALKMPQGEPHVPFFVPILRFASGTNERSNAEQLLRDFLQSPRIAARADDDLTLVLAVRSAAPAS
jgi:hypothetical protein